MSAAVYVVAAALCLVAQPRLVAVAGALAIGWSHLVGRCGMSHFGTLTPRGKLPHQRGRWLCDAVVYAAAGAVASATVGALLGAAGALVVPTGTRAGALIAVALLGFVAAAGELRVIRWRLRGPSRQTRREWGSMFRPPVPAALWGFCLGVTVATVFTFSGTWLVLAIPVAIGDPLFGATVLVAHWTGRAIPILLGRVLLDDAGHTLHVLDEIERRRSWFRGANVVGIVLIASSAVMLVDASMR